MDCFIKKIFDGRGEEAHNQFVRFGKGNFENKAVLNLQKVSKIKLRGSFEWANDFVEIASELTNMKFSGILLSKEVLDLENGRKKLGIYEYSVENISSEDVKKIKHKIYFMLLNGEGDGFVLKIKKKLPKLGKSGEAKVDDKFCSIEADLKYWGKIKDYFMLPECKKCRISHTYVIDELVVPENVERISKEEIDFKKIRLLAKRKGKIIRKREIDGKESQEEKEFEA